ncbi:GNAT family N-acetyltransferase [Streptomyces sp. SID1143]|uniref:GNAT family N-acetyltransferase n=1 Tax=Streptomyces sp. SID1143 TaxID=3425889 RepID=UPI0040566285
MSGIVYRLYEGRTVAGQLDAFLPVYEEVYAEPPYSEGPEDIAEFVEHFRVHARRAGIRLVLAREAGEVVGFAYGYLLAPDTRWWANVQEPLPGDFTWEDGTRTWVVIELGVRKPWRRRGIAGGLHDRLLEGLVVERVTLTVRPEPEAAPARAAYRSWGYRRVGRSHPWDDAPCYDAMVREIGPPCAEAP